MKQVCLLMLVISINGTVFAQKKGLDGNTEKTFEYPEKDIHRRFQLDLGQGNRVTLEVKNENDLSHFPHMDSLLRVFIQDMVIFKDTLSDDLSAKRIDYRIDSSGRKEIRIQQSWPKGTSYVLDKGDLAALKLEQDTIHIITETYKITLSINRLGALGMLLNGEIDEKIHTIAQSNHNDDWKKDKDGSVHAIKDPAITAKLPAGGILEPNDMLSLGVSSAAIQNYKNYFVPSFIVGFNVVINNGSGIFPHSTHKYKIGAYWEPAFAFQSPQGKLQTYRNDFVTLTFGIGKQDRSVKKKTELSNDFSLSYLVGRSGNMFDKNTFRLGLDEISLFKGDTKIEPLLYFNNFFKGVSPGIRLAEIF